MLFVFCINIILFCIPVCADGQGNVDGGGHGQMGEGSHNNQWIPGEEGVRVTIVDAATGTTMFTPIDLSNKSHVGIDIYHFKKQCKLTYLTGTVNLVTKHNNYEAHVPDYPLPIIISSNSLGESNPEEIKSYFTDNGALNYIAGLAGITFGELTGGEYKLVIEPIIYFYYTGKYYAMTAHEFFMMDAITGGSLRAYFKTLAYKNLAYSMFLEYDELGVPAWTGGTSNAASIEQAVRYLGIGIIHFNDNPIIPEEKLLISSNPYTYRCDTDVITSITVSSSVDVTPADPISVTFYINGNSYQVNGIVLPAGESQLVWCEWHTPSTPQNITGYAEISGRNHEVTIPIIIEDLKENEPPDPKASDENGKPVQVPENWEESEVEKALNSIKNNMNGYQTLSWEKWVAVADPRWEVIGSHTEWNEETQEDEDVDDYDWVIYYTYQENHYYATLNGKLELSADEKCPTAETTVRGTVQIGSGYGVDSEVNTEVNGIYNSGDITPAQNCIFYFPEFYYKTYWRLGELTEKGSSSSKLEFKHNKYSHFNTRTHFTPLWYPDAKDIYTDNYEIYVHMIDCWTPAGMLQCQSTDIIRIYGTVYDDWRVSEVLE